MKREQINPGFSKQIFEFSETEPGIKTIEFVNDKIVKNEIKFSYDKLQFMPDYIRLSVNVEYKLIGERGGIIDAIRNRYSYKILNGIEITVDELFEILKKCIERINTVIKSSNATLKNIPDVLAKPLLEDNYKDL